MSLVYRHTADKGHVDTQMKGSAGVPLRVWPTAAAALLYMWTASPGTTVPVSGTRTSRAAHSDWHRTTEHWARSTTVCRSAGGAANAVRARPYVWRRAASQGAEMSVAPWRKEAGGLAACGDRCWERAACFRAVSGGAPRELRLHSVALLAFKSTSEGVL